MTRRGTWRNWAQNQWATPATFARPRSEEELVAAVQAAATARRRVKAVGAGHSFTDIACTDGTLVSLDDHAELVSVDLPANRVTVGAGVRLHELSIRLRAMGMALPNLGDIDVQSVAGAVSTGTHGTGIGYRTISDAVVGVRLVTGDGTVVAADEAVEPEVLRHARVGLGALGVLSTVTLQLVPAFNLHAIEEEADVDDVMAGLHELVADNDHFEFYWVPHTRRALTKRNARTQDEPTGGDRRRRLEKELFENVGFGAINRFGRRFPSLVPGIARHMPAGGRSEYVAPSHEVFATPRRVRFLEMEYAVPREAFPEVFGELRALVERLPHPVSFPVEVRFLGGDDIPLSMASGRDSCFVAVHVYRGTPHHAYFAGVEAIMRAHGGRPHWGKLHHREAADLAESYPGWEAFLAVRDRLDPDRRFANPYLDRVLGR
jgi:L-gulono-1,4-lactone dehydrogenase